MKTLGILTAIAIVAIFNIVNANSFSKDVEVTFKDVKPIFQRYCVSCHEGSMTYEGAVASKDKILQKLVNLKQMPPKYISDRPSESEVELIKKWILTGTKE